MAIRGEKGLEGAMRSYKGEGGERSWKELLRIFSKAFKVFEGLSKVFKIVLKPCKDFKGLFSRPLEGLSRPPKSLMKAFLSAASFPPLRALYKALKGPKRP